MRKMIASVAVAGSLGVGGVVGMLLGTPVLSSAQSTSVKAGTESVPAAAEPSVSSAANGSVQGIVAAADPTLAPPADAGPLGGVLDEVLKGLVDKGTINQAQSDAVKAAVQAKVATLPRGGFRGGFKGDIVTTAAKALGMTNDELLTQLRAGKTVAQVAADKKVDIKVVINGRPMDEWPDFVRPLPLSHLAPKAEGRAP